MKIKRSQQYLVGMALVAFILLMPHASVAGKYPNPTAWVNDYAGVLSSSEKSNINIMLQDFEAAESTQVFVAIMKHIPTGMTIEEFANDLFAEWQIGQKKKNNGVLLLIAIQDRQLRIEVGYGLEDRLTDAQSKLIITNEIAPSFKKNRYGDGVTKGVNAIVAACRGAYSPEKTSYLKLSLDGINAIIGFFRDLYEEREALREIFIAIAMVVGIVIFRFVILSDVDFSGAEWSSHRSRYYHRRRGWSGSSWGGSRSSGGGFSGGGGGSSGGGGASGGW